MVWQQDVSVIAMTTLDTESGKTKCHRYWPESSDVTIDVYEKQVDDAVISIVRSIELSGIALADRAQPTACGYSEQ